jgi:hypothetical protein
LRRPFVYCSLDGVVQTTTEVSICRHSVTKRFAIDVSEFDGGASVVSNIDGHSKRFG